MQLKVYSVFILVFFPLWGFLAPTKIVLTGGPGVGKTMLIKELDRRGFNVVPEVATIIIEQAIKQGLPHPAHDLESLKIFINDICAMQKAKEQELFDNNLYFLDRGFHDPVAFCAFYNIEVPEQLREATVCAGYTYVFILDFLDVYENSVIRRETPETSKKLHALILETYQQYGYTLGQNLFCVPPFLYDEKNRKLGVQESVAKQVDFILQISLADII